MAMEGALRTGDDLLDGLTAPQRAAVTHVDGPLLVLAGPGSGKTRVITRRVAFLVRGVGIPPWNVLAITFTNKAAAEMRARVGELLTERQSRSISVSTFHSLCAKLLRMYAERLGLPPGYSIYDTGDQKSAIKTALDDLEISTKNFPPASMLAAISNAKNDLIGPEDFAKTAADFYSRTVAKVYRKYDEILTRNQALDFDDLLLKTVQLFREHPAVLAELQERFQYILIDEYQDTNHAQFMIASALANRYKNICATGDPDQSIYGWRGANIQNILDFESHYPDATVVRLEQNYRSTKRILAVADALIQRNAARKHKSLWTDNVEGDLVTVATCRDERHEARWVADQLQGRRDGGVAWGQMAIFYRMNSLSRVVEDELRNRGIPYQIARGTAFYDRAEIKDAVAYLRTIANPADEVNLLRIINTPTRGIGTKTIKAIQAYALAENVAVIDVIRDPSPVTALAARAQSSVAQFARQVDAWRDAAGFTEASPDVEVSLRAFVERVLRESTLHDHYANDKSDPDQERLANLGELVTLAQQFEEELAMDQVIDLDAEDPGPLGQEAAGEAALTLRDKLLALLERISLVSDVDAVSAESGSVTLMTLHAAKGLEFDTVAMVGIEDGLLPHDRALRENNDDAEEERRLCFVGITRAMRRLYLCHAQYRTVFGQSSATIPSRFLNELPAGDIEQVGAARDAMDEDDDPFAPNNVFGGAQRTLARQQAGQYPPGTRVRHPQFGLGQVVEVSAVGAHTKARIQFQTAGTKTLILQYARLEVAT